MDYYQKYLKYKEKYNNLKNIYGGLNNIQYDIFDLDFILPFTKDINNDFIFHNRLSYQTIDFIRTEIQNYYEYFYNYLMFPNLSFKNLKTYNLRDEIIIPIITKTSIIDNKNLNIGFVDYDLMSTKLKNINILEKLQVLNNLKNEINNYKEFIESIINSDNIFDISQEEIDNINNYDDIFTQIDNKINTKFFNKYKYYLDLYNDTVPKYNNSRGPERELFKKELADYEKKYNNILQIYKDCNNKLNNIFDLRNQLIQFTNSEIYLLYDLLNFNNTDDIRSMIEEKKKNICKNILAKFNKNPNLTTQILSVNLKFFDNNPDELNQDPIGHANSVTIYKFIKNNTISYLCLRTEPHRHTNIYCRNSVRKAIRDIFKYLPNSYYLDFIIDTKEGLQVNEHQDIEKENITDYDDIPTNIQKLSPLQGNTGFCASWTLYTLIILMLNRDKSLDTIGKYFATFNIKSDKKKKSKLFREEYDRCFNEKSDASCRSKEIFMNEFKKYINLKEIKINNQTQYNYKIQNENKLKYEYILTKHIKLYRAILLILYFITKKLNISNIINNINNQNDIHILNRIFDKFDRDNVMNKIFTKLNSVDSVKIEISQEILDKDRHLCDDNIFDHKEFCQIEDINKDIDDNNIKYCEFAKYGNTYKLKGLKSTLNDEKTELKESQNDTVNDISYLIKKII